MNPKTGIEAIDGNAAAITADARSAALASVPHPTGLEHGDSDGVTATLSGTPPGE